MNRPLWFARCEYISPSNTIEFWLVRSVQTHGLISLCDSNDSALGWGWVGSGLGWGEERREERRGEGEKHALWDTLAWEMLKERKWAPGRRVLYLPRCLGKLGRSGDPH